MNPVYLAICEARMLPYVLRTIQELLNGIKRNWIFRLIYEWPLDEKQLAFLAPANNDNFWIEIVGGGEDLQKLNYTDFNESLNLAGYHHFCLDVASVDKTLEELRIRMVTIVSEAFDLPIIGKRIASIADPYGNLIEVSENLR